MKLNEVIEILKEENALKQAQRSPKLYKGRARSLIQNRYNSYSSRNGSSLMMALNNTSAQPTNREPI